jgi:hypothetical protein
MKSSPRHIWLALVLAVGADASVAQQAPADPGAALAEQRLKYRVEFILFAHADADANEEIFVTEAADAGGLPPALEPFGALADADSPDDLKPIIPDPSGSEPPADAPFWFRVLRTDELALATTEARLANLRAYRVLASGGWIQEGLDENAAQAMNLANLGIVNPAGSLRLYVSRFLHLGIDLEFRAEPQARGDALGANPATLAELAPMGTKYRMIGQRRARSGELHYIDHPMFGLLFQISPAPDQVEPVEDDTAVLAPAI